MEQDWMQRTRLLMGDEKMRRLARAHVLVVGVGGVGAYAAEMLCRAGVGRLTLVDADTVQPTNLNRQLPALHSTLGQPKAEVLAARFRDINPQLLLDVRPVYLTEEDVPALLDDARPDFVVSMGAGAKTDITQVRFADVWDTYHCGLSKAVRQRLRKMGVRQKVPVVFSTEQANADAVCTVEGERNKKTTCGTVSYLPAAFGCYLAEYVIKRL